MVSTDTHTDGVGILYTRSEFRHHINGYGKILQEGYMGMLFNNLIKKGYLIFFCVTMLATLGIPAFSNAATTYYVSTNGNNANTGSQLEPFRTIKFALNHLVADDTLLIRGGIYSEKLESHNGTNFPSGTSWANPVTVAAYPGEQVTLVGKMAIGIERPLTQYVIFDGLTIDAKGRDNGISISGGTHHLRFINGEVKNSIGSAGILTSYNNAANHADTFHEFTNMHVHHNGITRNLDHGFYLSTSGNVIENCRIHDNAAWGIHIFTFDKKPKPSNNIFRNNLIYNNGIVLLSGGGITINRSDNNLMYNNVLWNNLNGIDIGGIGKNIRNKAFANTVFASKGSGIAIRAGGSDTQAKNNILHKNSTNLFNEGINTSLSKNLTTDPNFVDSTNADFHLLKISPAINNGIPLNEVKSDISGFPRSMVAPSIGAYEYTSQSTNQPPTNLRVVTR